jgi:hypothetical protein
MLDSCIEAAILEFNNPSILTIIIAYRPPSFEMIGSYLQGFQKIVIDKVISVVRKCLKEGIDPSIFQAICNVFGHVIPLARARMLYDSIQLGIYLYI